MTGSFFPLCMHSYRLRSIPDEGSSTNCNHFATISSSNHDNSFHQKVST